MRRIRRAPFMIGAAVVLPLLILLGVEFAFSARDERVAAQAEVLARMDHVLVEADGALQRTLGALDVLSTARSVSDRDWAMLDTRLRQVRALEPSWVTATLTDLGSGAVLIDIREPFGQRHDGRGFAIPRPRPERENAFVGGVGGSGPGCPCALVYRFLYRDGAPAYLITAAIDSATFLRILSREVEPGRVGALVDRRGNFVARTLDHNRRVGTPATPYVHQAIRSGRSGIYRGRTWEGFESYTAFTTSSLSGWSAHVAFTPSLLDSPRWRSLIAAGIAALASLVLALALVWFTLRQLAEGRRVQDRLQEAQKMEALGQITGGIAHDFNNLMTPILGSLDLLHRSSGLDTRASRLVEGALASARKAAKLTGQLLAFSRRQKMEIRPVDLAALLEELWPLLEQSAGASARVEIAVADGAGCVQTDANQLELALLNLVLNARDALPDGGGTVRIDARSAPRRGDGTAMVTIEVRDDGVGMTEDVLRRATEPFYTTKASGSGTGLGLAQVYGTVEQSGGTMSVESAPGRGTVVRLLLPAGALPPSAGAATPEAAARDGSGRRIVLCDDDDAVRTFVARVLDEAGYVVEAVSDGRSAVELVRNAAPDLLVVDFAMHGMNGAEVIGAARRIRADLPVVLITGYADTAAIGEVAADIRVLRKPFEAAALLVAIGKAIETRG